MITETKTDTSTPSTINEQPPSKTQVVLTEGERKAAEAAIEDEKPAKKGPITYKTIIGVFIFMLIMTWIAYVYRSNTPHTVTPAKPASQVIVPDLVDADIKHTPDLGYVDLLPIKETPVKDLSTNTKPVLTPVQCTLQSMQPVEQGKPTQTPVQAAPTKAKKRTVKKTTVTEPTTKTEVKQEPTKVGNPVQSQPEVHQEPQDKDGK